MSDLPYIIKGLSDTMRQAILGAYPCGTLVETIRPTEWALIDRGLAEAIRGDVPRRNRTSHHAQTVYDAYLGARLNDRGREVRAQLLAAKEA